MFNAHFGQRAARVFRGADAFPAARGDTKQEGDKMETIISGSRRITDPDIVDEAVRASGFTVTAVIEGGQRTYVDRRIVGGVDWLARLWALRNGLPVETVNADWSLHGKAAGPIRNREMAGKGKQLIAIPDDESRGTVDMIEAAKEFGLPFYVHHA